MHLLRSGVGREGVRRGRRWASEDGGWRGELKWRARGRGDGREVGEVGEEEGKGMEGGEEERKGKGMDDGGGREELMGRGRGGEKGGKMREREGR